MGVGVVLRSSMDVVIIVRVVVLCSVWCVVMLE